MRALPLLCSLLFCLPALAQQDEGFISYDDEPQPKARTRAAPKSKKKSKKAARPVPQPVEETSDELDGLGPRSQSIELEEYTEEPRRLQVDSYADHPDDVAATVTRSPKKDEDLWLSRSDDPNTGLAGELLAGVLLLESARGSGVDPRFGRGVRFTWEYGRVTGNENLANALFADVTWNWTSSGEGTAQVQGETNYHLMTVAPAYAWPVGRGADYAFFVQGGVGAAYQFVLIRDRETETQLAGLKTLLQYGAGFRGRPLLSDDGKLRVSFRVELTRFRRAYMDDTFLGGSIGAAF